MLSLPVLDAHLLACSQQWSSLLPQPGGRYCAQCARLVHDFSTIPDPTVALAAAHAASPDGRVCGRFGAPQVARPHLRPRLRQFLVALVLIMGLGLSARQALAQVRQAAQAHRPASPEPGFMGVVVEQMPSYKAGGMLGLQQFLQQHLRYPKGATKTGRVFVSFTVSKHGQAKEFKISKGLEPLLDAEVLRVMHLLGGFVPGTQNQRPVAVRYTLPITFSRE